MKKEVFVSKHITDGKSVCLKWQGSSRKDGSLR